MNLLMVIDDYLPNSTRVSAKMMHELALWLQDNGHKVVILTPCSEIKETTLDKTTHEGVEVWRFKSGPIKDISRVKRLINESLLSFKGWRAIKSEIKQQNFDGVVYYSPSIFFGSLVSKIKKVADCKSYLILRDLFPQWAIDEGIVGKHSPITLYLQFFEELNYKAADTIGLMSAKNIEVFNSLHPSYTNTQVLPNWVRNTKQIDNQPYWRDKLNLQNKVIFLYGGNIGKAQDMPNLMRLAKSMLEHEQGHFLFVGQGESYTEVEDFIKDNHLSNVTLLPSISQDAFKDLLLEVDVGLFSLAKNHTAHNFPGKILGYIANSLPILGSVNTGNDLQPVITDSNAGYVFENGEDSALLNAATLLLQSEDLRQTCGNNARQLLDSHFSVEATANKIISALNQI